MKILFFISNALTFCSKSLIINYQKVIFKNFYTLLLSGKQGRVTKTSVNWYIGVCPHQCNAQSLNTPVRKKKKILNLEL